MGSNLDSKSSATGLLSSSGRLGKQDVADATAKDVTTSRSSMRSVVPAYLYNDGPVDPTKLNSVAAAGAKL